MKVLEVSSHVHYGAGSILYHQQNLRSTYNNSSVIDAWVDKKTRAFVRKANVSLQGEGIRLDYKGQVGKMGDRGYHHAFCTYEDQLCRALSTTQEYSDGRILVDVFAPSRFSLN